MSAKSPYFAPLISGDRGSFMFDLMVRSNPQEHLDAETMRISA